MGKQYLFNTMIFDHLPEIQEAAELLRQIAEKKTARGPRSADKPLVLFGAGDLGRMAKAYFEKIGIPIKAFVDSNHDAYKNNDFWNGVEITHPSEVPLADRSTVLLVICVATTQFSTLYAELTDLGWTDVVPFYDITESYTDRHPLGNGWFTGDINTLDIINIDQVMGGWSDAVSRAHHLQFIAWHALREDWTFDGAPVTIHDRHFTEFVLSILTKGEIFCDIGAHHAEVIINFLKATQSQFDEILAFEPDEESFSILNTTVSNLDSGIAKRVRTHSFPIGAREEHGVFFQGLGYASQLSNLGRRDVMIKTIDQLNISPTFIKIHLEGGELDALKGGIQTITKHNPIIIVAIYHNRQGLWETSKWLLENLNNYMFFLRMHSWCGTGAFVYCVPKTRPPKAGSQTS